MRMTPRLQQALSERISLLEGERKYIDDFLAGIGSMRSSATDNDQVGVGIPRWFGAGNTFISNPSNVGVGVISRMIETDDTVLSAVHFKSIMMLSKIGEYQNDNKEHEDFVREFLTKMYGPTWTEAREAMSSHAGFGFSVSEVIWGMDQRNRKVPKRIKTYHPSTLCFEVDEWGDVTEDGIVQFVVQHGQYANPNHYMPSNGSGLPTKNPFETPVDRVLPYRQPFTNTYGIVRIPRAKCIHHVQNNMLSFGSPYGKTSVRTAHLAWQLKVFFMRQLGIAGKRQASPFIWGTAPHQNNKVKLTDGNGNSKEVSPIEALNELLANRQTDDSIVTGPATAGYSLQAIAADMDLNEFLDVIDHLNSYMFRAFLLPSLVMTDGQAGSRSLGDKHFEIVDRIAEEEAFNFGQTIVNQMIRKAIVDNYGEQENYGHFAQRPQSLDERERLAGMFSNLCTAGVMRAYDKTDNEYIRSTLHLPKQEESFYQAPMPNFPPAANPEDEQAREENLFDTKEPKP